MKDTVDLLCCFNIYQDVSGMGPVLLSVYFGWMQHTRQARPPTSTWSRKWLWRSCLGPACS
eukprot:2844818-Amphidinium_carterae.2